MTKMRRPFQDDTLVFPCYRQYYAATVLGHPTGDAHEEPVKLTQALNERILNETYQEWNARLIENTIAAHKFIKGELEDEAEKLKKFSGMTAETGLESTVEGMETGTVDATEGVEQAVGLFSDDSALEIMDDILTSDVMTTYGFHPPVINLPLSLSPAIIVMLLGNACDTFYHNMDTFSMEQNPFLEDWHYEDGVQTARTSFWYENAQDILERRHMRTGEKFRHLCVQRMGDEGEAMVTDILKDIRNERFSEYADTYIGAFPYSDQISPDCQNDSRSLFDLIASVLRGAIAFGFGWSFRPYVAWYPFPGIVQAIVTPDYKLTLPIDMVIPRFISILTGVNFWLGKYNLTPLPTTNEVIGQEMIIPTPNESANGYIMYGMDRIRYPPTMVQSKRVYGQEAQIREPTEYPCPEKKVMSLADATIEIEKARKEHPEWLTDVKGFGH